MQKYLKLVDNFSNSEWRIDEADITFGQKLGDGASGITYMGEYKGEKVAIKSYSASILTNDINSVKNEMDIMSRMKHKNIVQFRGLLLSRTKPSASLVTKFAERGELGEALYKTRLVRRRGDVLRYKIVLGLAEGLKYLHSYHVIHRDIKPANILLDDNYEPMLTDFGFSRFIDQDSTDNMTGETGSYRYMAPEVTRHAKYSEKADVYSFALICNEIFTDEKPFEFQVATEVAINVVKKGVRPSQKKLKNDRLKNIIARCWSQDPADRPPWDEVINELQLAQQGDRKGSSSLSSMFRKRGNGGASSSSSAA